MGQANKENGHFKQYSDLKELTLRYTGLLNFNILKDAPNLRVLTFDAYEESMSDSYRLFSASTELEIGGWTLPSLRELTFSLPVSPLNLRRLMRWTPNVERVIGIRLDDVKLPIVCENWRNLKELQDHGRDLTDDGVLAVLNGQKGGDDQEVPMIDNFEGLTYFGTLSTKLTSTSVLDGFLKLPNLKRLGFGEGSPMLDDYTMAHLDDRGIEFGTISWN